MKDKYTDLEFSQIVEQILNSFHVSTKQIIDICSAKSETSNFLKILFIKRVMEMQEHTIFGLFEETVGCWLSSSELFDQLKNKKK